MMHSFNLVKPTLEDILKPGFSTPVGAPMIPPYPFEFRNVEVMTLVYRTTKEAVNIHLPPPLLPASDIVMVHIYNMNDTDWIGRYNESNVMLACNLEGTDVTGGYSPFLFLSSAVGVSHGREVQGQPKKYGKPKIKFKGDLIVGTIKRNGIDVFTATMPYKQQKGDISKLREYFDFSTNINLKVIDHIDERPAIRQLTSRKLTDLKIHECWAGPCTVEIRPNAQAPLFRLPVTDMLAGYYWRADFKLIKGEIIYDYLKDEHK